MALKQRSVWPITASYAVSLLMPAIILGVIAGHLLGQVPSVHMLAQSTSWLHGSVVAMQWVTGVFTCLFVAVLLFRMWFYFERQAEVKAKRLEAMAAREGKAAFLRAKRGLVLRRRRNASMTGRLRHSRKRS